MSVDLRLGGAAFGALLLLAAGYGIGRWSGAASDHDELSREVVAAEDAVLRANAEREAQVAEMQRERELWAGEKTELQDEILRLTGELENAMAERIAREEHFVQFNEMMASIVPREAPPEIIAALGGRAPEPDEPEVRELDPSAIARQARSKELFHQLHTLLVTERVDSLELLEAGQLGDGWIGPIVMRILDDRGRPVGSLSADRLRLEGSRAGRTLTIVLEDGYERRGGEKIPFEETPAGVERGGVRRIFLKQTNPGPWFGLVPELFGPESIVPLTDDGRWHIFLVHRRLNRLLERDVELGYWRLSAVGGVLDDELRDVEVEHLDREGRLIKRLFADRLSIQLEQRGVLLLLRDGIQMRGGHKFDFLDGRYRIFLPNASQADWKAAGLPGLVPSKESSAGSHAPLQVSKG